MCFNTGCTSIMSYFAGNYVLLCRQLYLQRIDIRQILNSHSTKQLLQLIAVFTLTPNSSLELSLALRKTHQANTGTAGNGMV